MFIRKSTYKELVRLSYYDLSTGFFNRNWFEKNFIEKAKTGKLSMAIVDINFLKQINDLRGHTKGDEKIKEVGTKLGQFSKVVRWGGDEFYCIINPGQENDFVSMCKNQNEFAYAIECDFNRKDIKNVVEVLDKKMYDCKAEQKTKWIQNL